MPVTGSLAASAHGIYPWLSPLGTVVAAIAGAVITGFGAASLKHRWDVRADDTRWRRDRESRVRAQRLAAFAEYLAVRPNLRAARELTTRPRDAAGMVSDVRLAAANLLIVLPDPDDRAAVLSDLKAVEDWLASWLPGQTSEGSGDVPAPDPILSLARRLAVEQ
jgi:hypothetical protein